MVIFIQYYSTKANNLQVKLLCVVNVLENYDSANAATMHSVIKKQLERKQIPLSNLRGLATDGANVMVGTKNGLAALLKKDVKQLVAACTLHLPQASPSVYRH